MKQKISLYQGMKLIFLAFTIVIGFYIYDTIHRMQRQTQAELFYKMYDDFFIKNESNRQLIRDLGEGKPLLKENGGKYDVYNFDDYLGYFEMIKNYLDEGLEPERDIYDTYSYYIVQAYQNKEIWGYVKSLRVETKDSTYYHGFEQLANRFINVDKKMFNSH